MKYQFFNIPSNSKRQDGFALVITLVIVFLLVTFAVSFIYSVQLKNAMLHNYADSQQAYSMCWSGIYIVAAMVINKLSPNGQLEISSKIYNIKNPFGEGYKDIIVNVEAEEGKFNVNSLISQDGKIDPDELKGFKRLLKGIELDTTIADRIADWIDTDKEEQINNSEKNAKNKSLELLDEVWFIQGIDKASLKRLIPYITVYGDKKMIDINSAQIPVLLSLSEDISESMAKRIIDYRQATPFNEKNGIVKVVGVETIGQSLTGHIKTKSNFFSLHSQSENLDIKKQVDVVVELKGNKKSIEIKYWLEK